MSVVFEMLLGREFHALIVLGRYEYKSQRKFHFMTKYIASMFKDCFDASIGQ